MNSQRFFQASPHAFRIGGAILCFVTLVLLWFGVLSPFIGALHKEPEITAYPSTLVFIPVGLLFGLSYLFFGKHAHDRLQRSCGKAKIGDWIAIILALIGTLFFFFFRSFFAKLGYQF